MLFSYRDDCWKIADFGTASKATSIRLNTTRYSRGTTGYRAPEILVEVKPRYNNKVDIFSFGCIVYEIVTGQKLFVDDLDIREYSLTRRFSSPVQWPEGQPQDRLHALEKLASSMLEIDPHMRPRALDIDAQLLVIRSGVFNELDSFTQGAVPIEVITQMPCVIVALSFVFYY